MEGMTSDSVGLLCQLVLSFLLTWFTTATAQFQSEEGAARNGSAAINYTNILKEGSGQATSSVGGNLMAAAVGCGIFLVLVFIVAGCLFKQLGSYRSVKHKRQQRIRARAREASELLRQEAVVEEANCHNDTNPSTDRAIGAEGPGKGQSIRRSKVHFSEKFVVWDSQNSPRYYWAQRRSDSLRRSEDKTHMVSGLLPSSFPREGLRLDPSDKTGEVEEGDRVRGHRVSFEEQRSPTAEANSNLPDPELRRIRKASVGEIIIASVISAGEDDESFSASCGSDDRTSETSTDV